MNVNQLIDLLGLERLPVEGGLFRQTYRAKENLAPPNLPERYTVPKPLSTAIYFLLTNDEDSFSALHRLPTDEIYHFYLGDPVELLQLHEDGRGERIVLGHELAAGQRVQHLVRRGVWQGSRLIPGGRWALMGATMAPGFTAGDYEGGNPDELVAVYPDHAEMIRALTRPGEPLRM